jgi:hypothetical protein
MGPDFAIYTKHSIVMNEKDVMIGKNIVFVDMFFGVELIL